MINIEKVVQHAVATTKSDRPILAAPYELPAELCRGLFDKRVIGGYVAERSSSSHDPRVLGWWLDRDIGRWRLRRSALRELLFLGTESQVGGRMLLAARRAGISVFYVLDSQTEQVARMDVDRSILERLKSAVIGKALGTRFLGGVATGIGYTNRSFDRAFRDFYDVVGDSLRLRPDELEDRRLLMILGSLGPGGAERQAALTAIGLARQGWWRPVLGCNFLEGGGGDFHRATVESAGIRVEPIPETTPEMNEPVVQRILARSQQFRHLGFHNVAYVVLSHACFIRRQRPSAVQTWMDYSNVLAGVAADLVGIPTLVLSGRSMAPDNFSIFQPYMRPGYLELLRRRSVVFTNNSRAGADDYARWLGIPSDRFTIIPNGFEFPERRPEEAAASLKSTLQIPPGAPVVGAIIRFSEEKQPYLWIETAAKLTQRCPSAYFVVFGGGVMLDEVRNHVVGRGLADRIKLPGVTNDSWTALALMDVFLLTSRMEGLPNTLIEAQAMGVPVVTTGHGGMTETYIDGETGYTARPPTAGELAVHVERLLNDRELRKAMGQRAATHARRAFSAVAMIAATTKVLETVVGSSGAQMDSRR